MIPAMSKMGNATNSKPPTAMPIRITGKKMTQQRNFKIPQDTLSPKIKHFTINTIKKIVNINVSILLSLPQALFSRQALISFYYHSMIVCLFLYKSLTFSFYALHYTKGDDGNIQQKCGKGIG